MFIMKQTLRRVPACMKTWNKHQFANVHFICSIAALKARNNRISNQNLSETTQKIIREQCFGTFADSCTWFYQKKIEKFVYSPIRVTSKSVEKRVCNVSG